MSIHETMDSITFHFCVFHILPMGKYYVKCRSEMDRNDSLSFQIFRKKTESSRLTRFNRYLSRITVRKNSTCEI